MFLNTIVAALTLGTTVDAAAQTAPAAPLDLTRVLQFTADEQGNHDGSVRAPSGGVIAWRDAGRIVQYFAGDLVFSDTVFICQIDGRGTLYDCIAQDLSTDDGAMEYTCNPVSCHCDNSNPLLGGLWSVDCITMLVQACTVDGVVWKDGTIGICEHDPV
jgi:hypothetical protein